MPEMSINCMMEEGHKARTNAEIYDQGTWATLNIELSLQMGSLSNKAPSERQYENEGV
jgi:hypothetical protein